MRHSIALLVIVVCAGCGASGAGATSTPGGSSAPSLSSPAVVESPSPTIAPSASALPLVADDAQILYEWWDATGVKELRLIRADGRDAHPIATTTAPGVRHGDPSWSHDGQRLLYRVGELYASSIWTADANGVGARALLEPDTSCRLGMSSPAWGPDDAEILFICNDGASDTDPHFTSTIQVMTVATGDRRSVVGVPAPSQIVAAGWSRDGQTIVYQQGEYAADLLTETGSAIRSVPTAGGESRVLVDASMSAVYPSWSPVDDRILFSTNGFQFQASDVGSNLYTVLPDGRGLTELTHDSVDGARRYMASGWSPDGRTILVSIALASDGTHLDDVRLGMVAAAGGEPMEVPPGTHGAGPKIRPTP